MDNELIMPEAPEPTELEILYAGLKESEALAEVIEKLQELRQASLGVDEIRFRKVDTAHQVLSSVL